MFIYCIYMYLYLYFFIFELIGKVTLSVYPPTRRTINQQQAPLFSSWFCDWIMKCHLKIWKTGAQINSWQTGIDIRAALPFTPAAWCCCRWNHNHPMAQRHTKSHESHIPNSLTAILSSLCSNNCSATEVAVPQVVSHAHHCAFYAVYRLAGCCPVVKRRHSKRDCAPLLLTPRGVCVFLKDSGWSIHEK